jgi:hypothetical protein
MGFWRSLRTWWTWDGSPDTDPFRVADADDDDDDPGDVSGHAHAAADVEPAEPAGESDASSV